MSTEKPATNRWTRRRGLIVLLVYSYQNWRSRRAWNSFQAGLKQKGESLDGTTLLAGPVSDETNFARSPAFQKLLATRQNGLAKALLGRRDLILVGHGLVKAHQFGAAS